MQVSCAKCDQTFEIDEAEHHALGKWAALINHVDTEHPEYWQVILDLICVEPPDAYQ